MSLVYCSLHPCTTTPRGPPTAPHPPEQPHLQLHLVLRAGKCCLMVEFRLHICEALGLILSTAKKKGLPPTRAAIPYDWRRTLGFWPAGIRGSPRLVAKCAALSVYKRDKGNSQAIWATWAPLAWSWNRDWSLCITGKWKMRSGLAAALGRSQRGGNFLGTWRGFPKWNWQGGAGQPGEETAG